MGAMIGWKALGNEDERDKGRRCAKKGKAVDALCQGRLDDEYNCRLTTWDRNQSTADAVLIAALCGVFFTIAIGVYFETGCIPHSAHSILSAASPASPVAREFSRR